MVGGWSTIGGLPIGEFWIPVVLYALATSASPGPVNIVAAASGVSFGVWRTLPQVLGATFGFSSLMLLLGFGLTFTLFNITPILEPLRWIGAAFLLYLAWKIWNAGREQNESPGKRVAAPPTFMEGAFIQWLNPKAWIVALAGVTTYLVPGDMYIISLLALAIAFTIICSLSVAGWAALGWASKKTLSVTLVRHLNSVLALLLVLSIVALFV